MLEVVESHLDLDAHFARLCVAGPPDVSSEIAFKIGEHLGRRAKRHPEQPAARFVRGRPCRPESCEVEPRWTVERLVHQLGFDDVRGVVDPQVAVVPAPDDVPHPPLGDQGVRRDLVLDRNLPHAKKRRANLAVLPHRLPQGGQGGNRFARGVPRIRIVMEPAANIAFRVLPRYGK